MTGLRRVFAASAVVLFVLCLSIVTFAKDTEYSVKGQVLSVDPLAQKLTVKSIDKIPALISGTLGEFTRSRVLPRIDTFRTCYNRAGFK